MDAMERGYFKTGDTAMYDQDGWLYIQGRIEDIIIINNQRIFFMELENVILSHPFVKDVAIIGDNKTVLACVVRKSDTHLTTDRLMKYIYSSLVSLKNMKATSNFYILLLIRLY